MANQNDEPVSNQQQFESQVKSTAQVEPDYTDPSSQQSITSTPPDQYVPDYSQRIAGRTIDTLNEVQPEASTFFGDDYNLPSSQLSPLSSQETITGSTRKSTPPRSHPATSSQIVNPPMSQHESPSNTQSSVDWYSSQKCREYEAAFESVKEVSQESIENLAKNVPSQVDSGTDKKDEWKSETGDASSTQFMVKPPAIVPSKPDEKSKTGEDTKVEKKSTSEKNEEAKTSSGGGSK